MDEKNKKAVENKKAIAGELNIGSLSKKALEGLSINIPDIPDFSFPALSADTPGVFDLPPMKSQEEVNDYQSASVFMKALAEEAMQWKKQVPDGFRPAILAFLYGGAQINVHTLSKVSFHGIRIEGELNGGPCSLLAHQSTVQMLCFGQKITEEEPKRPIGFLWDDNNIEV